MNTYTLLSTLNWPQNFKDNKGTLTFTKSVGANLDTLNPGTVTSASVIAHADKIQLRVRTTSNGQDVLPILDAEWHLSDDGTNAALNKFVHNEQEQDLNEMVAVETFKDQVNALGVKPQFQGFGLRQTNTPAPTTFKFDL